VNKRIFTALILPVAAAGVFALSACNNNDDPPAPVTSTVYVPVPSASTTTEVVPVPSVSKSVKVIPSASVSVSVSPDDDGPDVLPGHGH
jgi:hypothetical protein